MVIKLTKKRLAASKQVKFTYGKFPVVIRKYISPITGNLFAVGTVDDSNLEAFVMKGEKRGELGGSIIECDALSKRDYYPFAQALAAASKFNKVRIEK